MHRMQGVLGMHDRRFLTYIFILLSQSKCHLNATELLVHKQMPFYGCFASILHGDHKATSSERAKGGHGLTVLYIPEAGGAHCWVLSAQETGKEGTCRLAFFPVELSGATSSLCSVETVWFVLHEQNPEMLLSHCKAFALAQGFGSFPLLAANP